MRRSISKALRLLPLVVIAGVATAQSPTPPARPSEYPIRSVPITAVRFTDEFWAPRITINREVTIPHIMQQNEETGRVENFLKAAHTVPGPYTGKRYNASDVYKAIEAASYALGAFRDPALDQRLDHLIALIGAAQEPDGYLYTARTTDPKTPPPGAGPARWSWLHTSHELYNVGHLYEAAVAHYQATGKRTLLDIALKNADLVCRTFGPDARHDVPGHEEIELALVKLYRVTGNRKYLGEANFFLEQRGNPHIDPPHKFDENDPFAIYNSLEYRQDHLPVAEQKRAIGHAVRATYLYSGMTDVGTLLDDEAFTKAADALWRDVVAKRMYVTGGLGSQGITEAFGGDYDLPNRTAYAETCASVGGMLWDYRMFEREGDGAYLDTFERTLYNGYLSGVSADGTAFFYQNPLESDGKAARSTYFEVACCPANLARLMGQLSGLTYATSADALYVALFAGNTAKLTVAGIPVTVTQATRYPWDGAVSIHLQPARPAKFALKVRIPGWARNEAVPSDLYHYEKRISDPPLLKVNGQAIPVSLDKGFATITREWKPGDGIELQLPMPIRRVIANPQVNADKDKVALQRGAVVYAFEAVDNGGRVLDLKLPADATLKHEFRPALLNGIEVITADLPPSDPSREKTITAVPYFAWANRGKGEMAVWIDQ
jgi:DUF1680 family protein